MYRNDEKEGHLCSSEVFVLGEYLYLSYQNHQKRDYININIIILIYSK